jgi:choline dehydrogenase-like flavoprotein
MLGCRCGAKWNAGSYVDQAVAAGATLITAAHITRVLRNGRTVLGVEGRINGEPLLVTADCVVLAAGGIGTPRILQASGFANAGQGLTVDSTLMVYGVGREPGIGSEPPMTWQWHSPDDEFMLSTLIDPWLMYPLAIAQTGLAQTASWSQWANTLGIMIKIKDDRAGHVQQRGISKPTTANDRERIEQAQQIARRILHEAGAKPESIVVTPLRGTHPASTARIGELVDQQLQTELDGLYICDASVFPEALGRPTVITIIGLGKRLATHLART